MNGLSVEDLVPFPTTGLAHDHVRCGKLGRLLRVPRQSQLGLRAQENLDYQAACFARMAESGHTPHIHGVIRPASDVPMGALIVEEIVGRRADLPRDLVALADALAAIHRLPVPAAAERAPLMDHENPVGATLGEVRKQAEHLSAETVPLSSAGRAAILAEIDEISSYAHDHAPPPKTLISFDAHPGNFILRADGGAVLVDLEKGRYGGAGFDLAHATLYTSTTWDIESYSELTVREVARFYRAWLGAMPEPLAQAYRPWLLPMRRLMWLWSVTWCAKWAVESRLEAVQDKLSALSTEDWSAQGIDQKLMMHVAGRVCRYLSDDCIQAVQSEWRTDNALTDLLSGPLR